MPTWQRWPCFLLMDVLASLVIDFQGPLHVDKYRVNTEDQVVHLYGLGLEVAHTSLLNVPLLLLLKTE